MDGFSVILKAAIRGLTRNIRRTFAVGLTIAVGAAAIFLFDGFNVGIMNQYRQNTIHSRFGYGQINTKGYRDQVFEEPWNQWMSGGDELLAGVRTIDGVTAVFPRTEFFALLTNGNITLSGKGQGIDGEAEAGFFKMLNVEEGVTLSTEEDGILLGKGLARSLNAHPGDRITVLANTVRGSLNALDFQVVGVFHTGSKDFDDVVFRIQRKRAEALLDTTKIESIALGLRGVEDWPKVEAAIRNNFPGLEATPFAVLDKVYYQHAVDWLDSQFQVILLIILVVVVLGILNSVSTGILERKREIGTLRANGESTFDVMRLLLAEASVLGLLSSVVGVVVAVVLNQTLLANGILMPPSPGITRQFHVFIEPQSIMAIKTILLGVSCTLIGTYVAASKVVKMPIAESLRAA